MPINLASPGILVREVDLTLGRVDPTSDKIGGIVGPFAQGPVGTPIRINSENDLLNTFGKPYGVDKHYETWYSASSFLAYGGSLNIIRADDTGLKNASIVTDAIDVKIKGVEHYEELGYDTNTLADTVVVAKNPGSWANGIRIGIIDGKADQIIGVSSTAVGDVEVGYGVTQKVPDGTLISSKTSIGTTEGLTGYFKGIVTGIVTTTGEAQVKFLSHVSEDGNTETPIDYNSTYKFSKPADGETNNITFSNNNDVGVATTAVSTITNWFDSQELSLTTNTSGGSISTTSVKWSTLAEAPGTSAFTADRGGRFDEVHVVVIDAKGTISGNAGTILEKHLNLSKAEDATFSVGSPSYWRKYLKNNSEYVFGLGEPSGAVTTGFSENFTKVSDSGWDQDAEGVIFNSVGALNAKMVNGKNYGGKVGIASTGALDCALSGLVEGYTIFENDTNVDVDFLIQGSSRGNKYDTRALATKLISVAEKRKDAIAFVSPHRSSMISDTSEQDRETILKDSVITDNVIDFFDPITSSSYAVFDSGYKYMYDRFANTFRYIPLNADIAGTCARTDINQFPWFSPAGTSRGTILNAVKLAYNPTKEQRDRLYSARINPVVFQPGAGIVLFGDKTGFAKASAFDRINVRRLFIFLEDAISAAAKDQLFEFNDEITRTNFVNIVEPFLRDVQAKRGIQDYVVICDETNNTGAIIDANEFIADIYIKPARSINFIGLTFVATRTGVSFEEVIGNV